MPRAMTRARLPALQDGRAAAPPSGRVEAWAGSLGRGMVPAGSGGGEAGDRRGKRTIAGARRARCRCRLRRFDGGDERRRRTKRPWRGRGPRHRCAGYGPARAARPRPEPAGARRHRRARSIAGRPHRVGTTPSRPPAARRDPGAGRIPDRDPRSAWRRGRARPGRRAPRQRGAPHARAPRRAPLPRPADVGAARRAPRSAQSECLVPPSAPARPSARRARSRR